MSRDVRDQIGTEKVFMYFFLLKDSISLDDIYIDKLIQDTKTEWKRP